MDVPLMMHGVKLRRLDEVAQPGGRPHVRVTEVLAGRGEEGVPERAQQRRAQQRIENQRAQGCIREDPDRVLVERRQQLYARWRKVDLVEYEPPAFRMTQP